ncbi:MAG: SDR family oxidoreductase [Sandarakinorhabdus sp.]|jgi:3-oxoacyl-[acyl-carrier protein] reductase|nr:SDR family oxidoreductase [Sandarakinorhabdus sp.]
MNRFEKKVVVITGGGGGMGVELCAAFAREGARVVLIDAFEQCVASGVAALKERGHDVGSAILDVADEKNVSAAFDRIVAEEGAIDVLVSAAGIRPVGNALEQPLDQWEACMRVNVTGVFVCARNAARHMLKKGSGAIINIASVNGVRAVTGMAAYNASKAAVISLTQTLASEFAPHGIRVNAILPAQVETPMIAEQVGEERKRREERIPLGRYGKPQEIASAACFLASDDASFITGHPLALDGGYLAFGFRPAVVPK